MTNKREENHCLICNKKAARIFKGHDFAGKSKKAENPTYSDNISYYIPICLDCFKRLEEELRELREGLTSEPNRAILTGE